MSLKTIPTVHKLLFFKTTDIYTLDKKIWINILSSYESKKKIWICRQLKYYQLRIRSEIGILARNYSKPGFEINIESVLWNSKSRQGAPTMVGCDLEKFWKFDPSRCSKTAFSCNFQNITTCLAKRNMHLFVIKNSNHSFIQRVTFHSQKDIFKHFQEYSFRK